MVTLPWHFLSFCSPLWASLALLAAPDPVSSRAHFGYPHTLNAFATCSFSFRMPSHWDTTVYARWYRVLTTLSLCSKGALEAVRSRLREDDSLGERTKLSVQNVCDPLELCLTSVYFVFKGVFYTQKHGGAIGSPISLVENRPKLVVQNIGKIPVQRKIETWI